MSIFSVITVTRNHLDGLRRTAASLRAQTCADYEWIVVDGASTDGTKDYLEETTARWISEPDGGIYDAMNKGIARASGDYLLFLNAGDELAALDVLEKIKNARAGQDFIYGDSREDGFYKAARPHTAIACGMFTHHQAMLYRRLHLNGLSYDTSYEIAADYKFTAQFLAQAATVLYCPFAICLFETGGVSQRRSTLGRREQQRARRELGLGGKVGNALTVARQIAASALRAASPGLYRRLRGTDRFKP